MTSRHSESTRIFNKSTGNGTRDRRDDFWDFDLPISRRGRFFDDSFFESSRFDFDKKVNEILGRWGEEERLDHWDDDHDFRPSSNLNRYRNLRARDLKDENQAMTVTSDDTAHKIVLDVQDFVNGKMKVKVIGERELAVEGRLDDKRSFRRCFHLPQNTDMDSITSVMSADGILTITASQKGAKAKETTSTKGSGADQSNTKESFTMSNESRKESSSRHSPNGKTDDSRNTRSYHSSSTFRDVPFMKRGRFFDDSFFESSRFDFDKKVNEILSRLGEEEKLDRWDDDSDLLLNNFNRYRNLRARDLKDENQAITVTSDDKNHKIVLDVQDFVNGEMKVKVIGERELAVEGRLDDKRSFRRCFHLPQNTDMDSITSVMSADGILTISAPQKGHDVKQGIKLVQMTSDGNTKTTEESLSTQTATAATTKQREAQESEAHKTADEKKFQADVASTHSSSGVSGETHKSSQSIISTQTKANTASNGTQTSECAAEKAVKEGNLNKSISTQTSRNEERESEDMQQCEVRRGRRSALPITRRGQFFNDSYFEDTWKDYQDAVRKILTQWDDHSTASSDDMTCYRRLRSRDMRDENQAITSTEDQSSYKFVLDVHDFLEGGDISVNVVDETELVVEGQVDRDTGDSKSSDHFLRRFALPEDVQLDSISSVMSSDGVLTIIAPKKSSMIRVTSNVEAGEKGVHISTGHTGKQSQDASEVSTSAVSTRMSETEEISGSSHLNRTSLSEKERDVIIPVQIESSSEAGKENLIKTEQAIAVEVEGSAGVTGEKKSEMKGAEHRDEGDAVHRRLEEEGEEDDSKSGMAALRKVLEEDESYIKHKNRSVPINNHGVFFEDPDFTNWRICFLCAVKDVLTKFHVASSEEGDLAAYRGLRQRDLKLENQAAYVDEHQRAHTVVLDVYDFLDGNITAEIKDGRELIVKGTTQRREGLSLITLTFVKPFKLPDNADLKNISAFLTSDGVLIINVPRLMLPYDLPDLGGTKTKESRPVLTAPLDPCQRLSTERTTRDSSRDLDGVTYRMSPLRNMKGDDHSSY